VWGVDLLVLRLGLDVVGDDALLLADVEGVDAEDEAGVEAEDDCERATVAHPIRTTIRASIVFILILVEGYSKLSETKR